MDLTEPEPRPEMSEQTGEYRLQFRYQLWSQAAQDFRSRPPVAQRFSSTSSHRTAIDLNPSPAEGYEASDADIAPAADEGPR
jgi:hypothetical protein